MKIVGIEIKNFKGIQHIKLDFEKNTNNIITLIGLNESGKTTILEAINCFEYNEENTKSLSMEQAFIKDKFEMIPIKKRANFNGEISIKISFKLDKADNEFIKEKINENLGIDIKNEIDKIEVEQQYIFEDSKYKKTTFLWGGAEFEYYKSNRSKKITKLDARSEEWKRAITIIKELMPSILYFPTFVFDFPNRIYLEDEKKEDEKNIFFKNVMQDILAGLDNPLDIDKHIKDRILEAQKDTNAKESLEQALIQIERKIDYEVFNEWSSINPNDNAISKELKIDYGIDEKYGSYLEFSIQDMDGKFKINERSLGFRWFFVFFLLILFRGNRKNKNVVFLFDEPAANLHQTAQIKLLDNLKKISNNSMIIYTTHSQYLINPKWLDNDYIVKNEGLDYNNDNSYYSAQTDIKIWKYKEFVSNYPDSVDYFQIVLDVLKIMPSRLEKVNNAVILEGKNDYYTLKFMESRLDKEYNIDFIPGLGSGNLDTIISLYIAWGKNIIVLLDSDDAGEKERNRYIKKYGKILENRIFTYSDIDNKWANNAMEKIIGKEECIRFSKSIYPNLVKPNKKTFNRAIQEAMITNNKFEFKENTISNIKKIFEFLAQKLD